MINLEKHFILFARENLSLIEQSEDKLLATLQLYDKWKESRFDDLGGTPTEYIKAADTPSLANSLTSFRCQAVVDELILRDDSTDLVLPLMKKSGGDALLTDCANILNGQGKVCADTYLRLVKADGDALSELLISGLKTADVKADKLIAAAKQRPELSDIVGEILICKGRSEAAFNFLTDLFLSKRNIPMHAGFLGVYGDERAAAVLYPALDNADYVDYTEIKNAIERLGGIVDETLRDFDSDPLFTLIKNSTLTSE